MRLLEQIIAYIVLVQRLFDCKRTKLKLFLFYSGKYNSKVWLGITGGVCVCVSSFSYVHIIRRNRDCTPNPDSNILGTVETLLEIFYSLHLQQTTESLISVI